jgi:hypothetical protein
MGRFRLDSVCTKRVVYFDVYWLFVTLSHWKGLGQTFIPENKQIPKDALQMFCDEPNFVWKLATKRKLNIDKWHELKELLLKWLLLNLYIIPAWCTRQTKRIAPLSFTHWCRKNRTKNKQRLHFRWTAIRQR